MGCLSLGGIMKKYIVTEEFLSLYKKLVEEYGNHDRKCTYWDTEFCSCGFSSTIRYMKQIGSESVKPYENNV